MALSEDESIDILAKYMESGYNNKVIEHLGREDLRGLLKNALRAYVVSIRRNGEILDQTRSMNTNVDEMIERVRKW